MIPLVYVSYHIARPPMLFGDQIMLRDLTDKDGGFEEIIGMKYDVDGAVVTIPLHHNENYIHNLNGDIRKLKWCVIVLTANEFASAAYRDIKHPNMKIWLTTPDKLDEADRFMPLGYPSLIKKPDVQRTRDWFFSGQITNPRRLECAEVLRTLDGGLLKETEGFGQGYFYDEYIELMAGSKVIPCPSGPETPDTYRLYEALELGCIPVTDSAWYWEKMFGEVPFKSVDKWSEFPGILASELDDFDRRAKQIGAWWEDYKITLMKNLHDDVRELKGKV